MSTDKVSLQIKMSEELRDKLKIVAIENKLTLNKYVFKLLSSTENSELKQMIADELAEQPKPGRPSSK